MNMPEGGRYQRFIPYPIRIVGGGGIGSNVAPLFAKCGPPLIELWDDDIVAPVNLQMQNFGEADLGLSKVDVVAQQILRLNPTIEVVTHNRRLTPSDPLDGLVVAAVDSLEGRAMTFDSVLAQCGNDKIPLYLDGRFRRGFPEYFELYAIDPRVKTQVDAYQPFLFRGTVLEKEPRPTTLAAHTPYGLAWAIGCILARWAAGEDRPWKVVGDGAAMHVEWCMVSEMS